MTIKESTPVTKARCKCGWQGSVTDCIHKPSIESYPDVYAGEVIGIDFDEVIIDLCPDCLLKRNIESEVNYL